MVERVVEEQVGNGGHQPASDTHNDLDVLPLETLQTVDDTVVVTPDQHP